jgi:2',3'-cyclic-nucleotide 2'-phosphodiesterase (5'-nucleotidase family)
VDFELGKAQAEYIFSEVNPPGPFNTSGQLWDRLTRRKETALGNLFCDGSAWYVRTKHNETFDFVFLNGGYIDQPLGKGAITVGSIESMPPPASRSDFYTLITLRGPELKMLLDQAASVRNMGRGGKNTGAWGMVSREMRYTIQSPPKGSSTNYEIFFYGKIKDGSVTLNGQPLDFSASATYRVCTANYLAGGGDGYTAFVVALRDYPQIANVRNIHVPVWQGVCEYIYDKGSVTPYTDGRVKQVGGGVMCEE